MWEREAKKEIHYTYMVSGTGSSVCSVYLGRSHCLWEREAKRKYISDAADT